MLEKLCGAGQKIKEKINPSYDRSKMTDVLLMRALFDSGYQGDLLVFQARVMFKGLLSVAHGLEIQKTVFEDVERRLQKNTDRLPDDLQGDIEYIAGIATRFAFYPWANGNQEIPITTHIIVTAPLSLYSEGRVARRQTPQPPENASQKLREVFEKMSTAGYIQVKQNKDKQMAYLSDKIDSLLV
jgi:hypothetical protein